MQFSPRFSGTKGGHLSRVWNKIFLLIIRRFLKHKEAVIERGIGECTIIKHAVFIFNSRLCYI